MWSRKGAGLAPEAESVPLSPPLAHQSFCVASGGYRGGGGGGGLTEVTPKMSSSNSPTH